MDYVNAIADKLQTVDPLIWTALASYLAPYAQELLKGVTSFTERANYLLSLVVIPGVIAILTGLQDPHLLGNVHPLLQLVLTTTFAAVISQLKYGLSLNPRLKQKAELQALRSQVQPVVAEAPVQTEQVAAY